MALKGSGSRRRKRLRREFGIYASQSDMRTPPEVPIERIKSRAKKCNTNWFDKGAMRFFNTRLPKKAFASQGAKCFYFVTSEAFDYKSKRKYTVRRQCSCKVDTVGEFQQYASQKSATTVAKRLAKKDKR